MEKEEGQDVEKASSSSRDGAFIFAFVRDPRIVDFRVPGGFFGFFLWAGPPTSTCFARTHLVFYQY